MNINNLKDDIGSVTNPRPPAIAFSIGPIDFYWYGIILLIAIIITCFFILIEWFKKGYQFRYFEYLLFISLVFGFLGARWWYVIFNDPIADIRANGFFTFFMINSGRAIEGAIFFGMIAVAISIKVFNIPVSYLDAFDIILPNMLLAQSIGRWGNFANFEIYGSQINSSSWLVNSLPNFILNGMTDLDGYIYQPLFLYESLATFFGWMWINFVIKNIKPVKVGLAGSLYFLYYGIVRSIMELYRDDSFIMAWGNIPTSFIISIIFILVGIGLTIYFSFFFKSIKIED